jgi:hypothetical protein
MDHLFIVRIWSEPRDGEPHFRGSVEHVGSRLRRHFADPAGLVEYLEGRVGEAALEIVPVSERAQGTSSSELPA